MPDDVVKTGRVRAKMEMIGSREGKVSNNIC
jgi:hypothetical protein